jgi:hypothetical protein
MLFNASLKVQTNVSASGKLKHIFSVFTAQLTLPTMSLLSTLPSHGMLHDANVLSLKYKQVSASGKLKHIFPVFIAQLTLPTKSLLLTLPSHGMLHDANVLSLKYKPHPAST